MATDCAGSTPGVVSGVVITRASIANNASINSSCGAGRAAFAEQVFNKYNNIVTTCLTFLLLGPLLTSTHCSCLLGRLLGIICHFVPNTVSLYWLLGNAAKFRINIAEARHLKDKWEMSRARFGKKRQAPYWIWKTDYLFFSFLVDLRGHLINSSEAEIERK